MRIGSTAARLFRLCGILDTGSCFDVARRRQRMDESRKMLGPGGRPGKVMLICSQSARLRYSVSDTISQHVPKMSGHAALYGGPNQREGCDVMLLER